MRLSVSFGGFGPLAATFPVVAAAETHGLDGIWSCEHVGFHDAVVPSATYLATSRTIDVGLVGCAATSRHPGVLAMELASLCELGPGRVRVQVGLGDAFLISRIGGRYSRPLQTVTELVESLRALFEGATLDGAYAGHAFAGYRIQPPAVPPSIDIMAVRPRMLELAGRVADGVSLSTAASAEYLGQAVEHVEQALRSHGREREEFRITAMALGCVGDRESDAAQRLSATLGIFSPEMLALLAPGVNPLAEPHRVAVVATPDSLGDALARYAATGIDELAIDLANQPDEIADLMPLLVAARPEGVSRR